MLEPDDFSLLMRLGDGYAPLSITDRNEVSRILGLPAGSDGSSLMREMREQNKLLTKACNDLSDAHSVGGADAVKACLARHIDGHSSPFVLHTLSRFVAQLAGRS